MTTPLYPKWDEIMNIENAMLRTALYTAEDEELERLQAAFPECYSEELEHLRFPASIVRAIAIGQAARDFQVNEDTVEQVEKEEWIYGTDFLRMPRAFQWECGDEEFNLLPDEVREQLSRVSDIKCGVTVQYLGETFIVVWIFYCGESLDLQKDYDIAVVHSRFIDLDS